MPRTACLTPAELAAFQLGDLPEDALDEVAAHLDVCPRCETAAQALDALTDPGVTPFRRTAQARALPEQEALPQSVDGHEILEEIGRGGMGVVYKARNVRLNRTVALKMLLGGTFVEREERVRFRAEAEAVARLHHPNIVQVYEVGEYDDGTGLPRPYFTLEFVDGGNLSDRLAGRPQPPGQAAAWLEPLARAVHYAHTQGVIHRDLKASNVLLTRDGQPKVCDFGVAKRLEGSDVRTRSGLLVGTVEYMAPEQAAGSAVGPAADVHALGALLYALLTGRPPYQAASVYETLLRLQSEEPVPPSRLQPGVPRDLDTLCLKCLEKDPARRYASAADLADDLRRFRAREPVRARPVGPLERAAKWVRRRPAVAALLAAVVLVTAAAFALVTWQWGEALSQRHLADEKAEGEAKAKRLAQERERREQQARREAERLSAGAILDQGAALCDRGEVAQGLLWLARGLELSVQAGDADLERVARVNLKAWQSRFIRPATSLSHGGWVWTGAFSPDGKLAATASYDRTARLWDVATGKPRGAPLEHAYPVWAVAFSPDGKTLLTGSSDDPGLTELDAQNEFRLWDVASGRPLTPPLTGMGFCKAVGFSKDGRRFLTASAAAVRLWDTADRQPRGRSLPYSAQIGTAAFTPDGAYVLTGGADGTVRLWDAATGAARGEPLPHRGPVEVVAFSPDGRTLAAGGPVPVWDRATGKLLPEGAVRLWHWTTGAAGGGPLPCGGWVRALAFGADGRTLVAGGVRLTKEWREGSDNNFGGEARLWRAPAVTGGAGGSWRLAVPPLEHPRPVRAVALSPDGRLLLTGAEDSCTRIFQTATGSLLHGPLSGDGPVTAAAFSSDGRAALNGASGGNQVVSGRLWRLAQGPGPRRVEGPGKPVTVLRYRPGGRTFVTAGHGGVARLWDAATGRPHGPPMRHAGWINDAAFSPDGKTLATVGEDRTARLWDAATARPRGEPLAHETAVTCVAFSPDGKTLLTGGAGTFSAGKTGHSWVRLWDVATGRPQGEPLEGDTTLSLVAFSPDGRTLLAASSFRVRCWRVADRQPVPELWFKALRVRVPAAFSPDGTTLAGAAEDSVRLWDSAGARLLRQWPFPMPMDSVQFSPDGKTLLLGFSQHSAQLWDVAQARPKTQPLFHRGGAIRALTFSPDGRMVLTGSADRTARLWDAATGKQLGPPLLHAGLINRLAFRPSGRSLATGSEDGSVLLWPVPGAEPGDVEAVRRRMERLTGMRLDDRGIIRWAGAEPAP
jgi:WD40 repeat protein/tRNA A-37 threonylcarbamoyl transferase component Bud32